MTPDEHSFQVTGYTTARYDAVIQAPTAEDAKDLLREDIKNGVIAATMIVLTEADAQQICRHEPVDPDDDTDHDGDEKPE